SGTPPATRRCRPTTAAGAPTRWRRGRSRSRPRAPSCGPLLGRARQRRGDHQCGREPESGEEGNEAHDEDSVVAARRRRELHPDRRQQAVVHCGHRHRDTERFPLRVQVLSPFGAQDTRPAAPPGQVDEHRRDVPVELVVAGEPLAREPPRATERIGYVGRRAAGEQYPVLDAKGEASQRDQRDRGAGMREMPREAGPAAATMEHEGQDEPDGKRDPFHRTPTRGAERAEQDEEERDRAEPPRREPPSPRRAPRDPLRERHTEDGRGDHQRGARPR
ncbi:MAG: hypothetical protein ACRDL7_09160, partial [Gaiellaceae bacterium]